MNIKNKILVICHDAGAAEILSAYVKAHKKDSKFYCVVAGPAGKIFRQKKIKNSIVVSKIKASEIFKKFRDVNLLLTGTGWGSRMEIDFIREARNRGIKSVSFLDHWVNYRERFGYPKRGWRKNLPDEIWVGDGHAFSLAKKLFSGCRVKLTSNPFFREIKAEYKKAEKRWGRKSTAILFAAEPVNAASSSFGNKNHDLHAEEKILELFLDCLSIISRNENVIIRYHPSESGDKYKKIINKYNGKLKIERSVGRNMYDDLARSGCVVGMKSMFLAVAELCGKKAISFMPGKSGRCALPADRIIKIKTAKKLRDVLLACRASVNT